MMDNGNIAVSPVFRCEWWRDPQCGPDIGTLYCVRGPEIRSLRWAFVDLNSRGPRHALDSAVYCINLSTAALSYINFHPLEAVRRCREAQLRLGNKY